MTHTPERLFYAERDIGEIAIYYTAHVCAMTAEGLHSKSDIAAELAHRDMVIHELLEALKDLERVSGTGMPSDDPARVAARAAIAKAEAA